MKIIGNPKYLYIGTKAVLAHLMTKEEYCDYREWQVPENEDPAEQGYFVEYMDGSKPNHPNHVGYVSWSPACVFKDAYQPNGALSFSAALEALKVGKKVARSGWNGKGMWLAFVKPYNDAVKSVGVPCFSYRVFELPEGANGEPKKSPKLLPYIAMKTVGDELVPWLASQTDVLAEDWIIL